MNLYELSDQKLNEYYDNKVSLIFENQEIKCD